MREASEMLFDIQNNDFARWRPPTSEMDSNTVDPTIVQRLNPLSCLSVRFNFIILFHFER